MAYCVTFHPYILFTNQQPWQTAPHSVLIFPPQIGSHGRLRHIPFLYSHHKLAVTADCVTFHSYILTTNWQPVPLRYFLFKLSLVCSYSLIYCMSGLHHELRSLSSLQTTHFCNYPCQFEKKKVVQFYSRAVSCGCCW